MDLGYAAGGFAEGLGGGLRTALDVIDFRDRRRFAEEDRKNKAEDRKLALEDRALNRTQLQRQDRLGEMNEKLSADQFRETMRQNELRDTLRSGLRDRVQAENEKRQQFSTALENTAPGDLSLPAPPTPQGTLSMYDDMLDKPPKEWEGDPSYARAITDMRTTAEREGLGEVYTAWKRKATPKEIGRIYNRFGDHYATEFKAGTAFSDDEVKAMGYDPTQKKDLMVAIDDKGKHIPMHMGELGRFLGKEKAPKYVKGPDNSGVVYNEENPNQFVQFPDQPTPENRMKMEEFRLRLRESDRKAWEDGVGRINAQIKNSYQSGAEVNFDPNIGQKQLAVQGLAQTWYANGMTLNGAPVEPERIAEIAREVTEGRLPKEQLDAAGYAFSGRPAFMGGRAASGGGGGKPFVVQSDTKPTAPPKGADADGNWRRGEQGWIYVSKDGANVWQDETPAPAKPAAASGAAPAAAKSAAPKVQPVRTQPEPGVMNLFRRAMGPTGPSGLEGTISVPGQPGARPIGQLSGEEKLALQQAGRRAQAPTALEAPPSATTALDAAKPVNGMVEPGNIDLKNRKVLNNADGTYSTESSITITEKGRDGREVAVNLPTVIDGKRYGDKEAVAYYKRTGEHLGKFASIQAAEAAAQGTHLDQEKRYEGGRGLEIPPKPSGGKGFTSKKSGDMEVYRFADGEVGFFEKDPESAGMLFRRVDGRGQPKGTPIMVKDRETFIRIHSKGTR